MKPLNDRVIVKRDEAREVVGGIIIPENAKEKTQIGTVIAVGIGRYTNAGILIPINDLKPGDRVVFGKFAGAEAEFDGKEYTILRENEIFAVL